MSNTKWPKAWCVALIESFPTLSITDTHRILDCLDKIGALKEPPKPREWWLCKNCYSINSIVAEVMGNRCLCLPQDRNLVKVREVLEGDE